MAEPNLAQKGPYLRDEPVGRRMWCACGLSQTQPYCDRSHRGTEFRPIVATIETAGPVEWCGCKRSGNKPYCDGTHETL